MDMEKYEKRNTHFLVGSFICVLLLCIAIFTAMTVYMRNESSEAMQNVGEIYMKETSNQLRRHFNSVIELRLSQVEGIIRRTPPEDFNGYSDMMMEQLEISGRVRGFSYLALYATDGTEEVIYGEPIKAENESEFLASLNAEESKLIQGETASGEKVMMLGVSTTYPMKSGKSCTGLVAGIDWEYMSDIIVMEEDNALLYSHIIARDGSFLVRNGRQADASEEQNFYEFLLGMEREDGDDVEQIVQEMAEAVDAGKEYATVLMAQDEIGRRAIYCAPMPHSDWYLVNVMPYGTLDRSVQDVGNKRMESTFVACAAVLVLMFAIFVQYYRMSKKQMSLLSHAQQEAERANRAKSVFLSSMSHDIRTPMNAIMGMTTIASKNIDKPEQVKDCLRKITLSSKHLLGLINDVLDMSKIESGKLLLNRELVSLREATDSIVNIVQPQIKAKKQNFDVFIQNIQTETVYIDGIRLNQVLLNLLSNALKFTPEGGTITMSMTQEDSSAGDDYVRLHFWVRDTGIGMTKEFQKTIFEAFAREDNPHVQRTEGVGLGMAITKHIVDAAGGTIEVDSEPGNGSAFHVILDVERADISEENMTLPGWEMLVVDDDEELCRGAVGCLKDIGVQAEWALDGASAIEMAEVRHMQHHDYNIVLLDWKMPGIDGIETARRLHAKIGKDVPLLLISAYDWSEIEEDARAAGISGFISKPLFKSTLYYGLSRYAGRSKAQDTEEYPKLQMDFTGYRLLMAEDVELNWEVANEMLSSYGFKLEWAENGKRCVEMFKQSIPGFYDAILMDLRMPVMNGFEATKAIRVMDRTDAKSIPIIAMTADVFAEDIKKCRECGMDAHTPKPLDIRALIRILSNVLGENQR